MSHAFYVYASYVVTVIIIGCLVGWTWLDGRARQQELRTLEASGIRRRSAKPADETKS